MFIRNKILSAAFSTVLTIFILLYPNMFVWNPVIVGFYRFSHQHFFNDKIHSLGSRWYPQGEYLAGTNFHKVFKKRFRRTRIKKNHRIEGF